VGGGLKEGRVVTVNKLGELPARSRGRDLSAVLRASRHAE
jgi:hypothetical protein